MSEKRDEDYLSTRNAEILNTLKRRRRKWAEEEKVHDADNATEASALTDNAGSEDGEDLEVEFENLGELKTIYEDGNLKFQVQKRVPKSFHKFSAEDHSYRLIVVQKEEKSELPLLISLLNGLAKAIDKVLTMLKKNYNQSEHRMVYLSIVENSIIGAIHSGGFDLQTPNNVIVDTIMGYLKTALQSEKHLNLKLNDSFELHFAVISPRHVSDMAARGKKVHFYGAGNYDPRKEGFLINFGSQFGPNCLIASCLASKANNLLLMDKTDIDAEEWMKFILPEDENNQDFIKEKIQEVKINLGLGPGPHQEDVLYQLASYFKCEICVFSLEEDLKITFRTALKFSPEDEILYLVSENNGLEKHVMSLINLRKFFNRHNRFACIFCSKIFHSSKGLHRCKSFKEFCFTCYRPIGKKSYFINEMNRNFFCFPEITERPCCTICSRAPASEECGKFHKYHCKKAFFCQKCQRTILVSRGNLQDSKSRHSCLQKCKVCSEENESLKSHVCLMKMPKIQKNWPKMLIAYEFNSNVYEFKEENHHGEFVMNINGKKFSTRKKDYFPPNFVKKKLNNHSLQTNFGQNCKRLNFETFFRPEKNEMEKFLFSLLCKEEMQNTSVLFISKTGLDNLMENLLRLKIKPLITRNKKGVTLISFKSQNVRFLDASSFFNVQYFEDPILTLETNFENAIKFLTEIFRIQYEAKKDLTFLHPFGSPFTTRSSLMFNIFKMFYLNEKLFVIKKERTGINSPSSKAEIKFVYWLQKQFPNEEIISSISPYGQQYFKSSIPDAFLPNQNFAAYFQGCSVHSHDSTVCPLRKGRNTNFKGIPDFEIQKKDKEKRENLEKEIPGIKIEHYFECEMNKLWKDEGFKAPLRSPRRLCPKDANRGGRNEVFCNFCELSNETEEILSLDIISSYPFEAMRQDYPIGRYEILIGKEVEAISFNGKQFLYKKKPLLGLVHADIFPPRDLRIPFLPFNVNGKVSYAFCFKCAKDKNQFPCTHSNAQRKFTSTYTSVEINYACVLGYRVKIWEVYNYKEEESFMKDFIKTLAFFKIKNSGFPKGLEIQDRSNFVDKTNKHMNFSSPFLLSESNIIENEFERELYKQSLNSFCGKWAQGTSKDFKEKTIFFDNGEEFLNSIFKKRNVSYLGLITEDICEAVIKTPKSRISGNPEGNLIYNAMITAFARIRLFEAMQEIEKCNGKVLYCDTDGIIFKCPRGQNPIKVGNLFGDFRNVHEGKEIQCFYSLGPKNFALVFKQDDRTSDLVKVSGLSLAKEKVDLQVYKEMVKNSMNEILNEVKLTQTKKMKKNYAVKEIDSFFTLRNSIEKRRVHFINDKSEHDSLPFGYVKKV